MLALLLMFAVSVYPWYLTWMAPLAALADSSRLRRSILVACAASMVLYAVPYGWVERVPSHAVWATVRLSAAFLVPLALWIWFESRPRPAGCG